MKITGTLKKLKSHLASPVEYQLPLSDQLVDLNPLIGQQIRLTHTGNIFCCHCGSKTNKSFSQGFCFPCMRKLAQCDMCIMKPETCHFDQGTCREPDWAQTHCFVDHFVYLSNTSGVKVGITRHSQIPTRWIDQGATQGLIIFKVRTRKQSGLVETLFKEEVADKTNWRQMLKGDGEPLDLNLIAQQIRQKLELRLQAMVRSNQLEGLERIQSETQEINYPVEKFPSKIVSLNFDKNPMVKGRLQGIKGQYLFFDTGVINIRKFTSYEVEFES